jgi:hypothetical protein
MKTIRELADDVLCRWKKEGKIPADWSIADLPEEVVRQLVDEIERLCCAEKERGKYGRA